MVLRIGARWKTEQTIAGMFYNLNPPGSHVYTPDLEPARPSKAIATATRACA